MALALNEDDASEELLNLSDFQSIEIEILLKNMTSKTIVGLGKKELGSKTVKDPELQVLVTEFLEDGFALSVPENCCTEGHQIGVHFFVKFPSKDKTKRESKEYIVQGRVKAVEKTGTHLETVYTVILPEDVVSFEEFKEIFVKRQEEITLFFEAVKGE